MLPNMQQLQRLVALKKQQSQHYGHILQQHYENRNIIEEAYANDNTFKSSDDYDESTPCEDDEAEKLNYYANVHAKKFTMSPDATDYDSNGGDDSDFSLRYISSELSLSTNNLTTVGEQPTSLDMPALEDGLSDNENSFPDINYNVTTRRNKTSTSAHHQLEKHHRRSSNSSSICATNNRDLSSIDMNINNLHLSKESISDERTLSHDTESELITNNQNHITSEVSNLSPPSLLYEAAAAHASETSITPVNVGKASAASPTAKRDEEEADTDLETDRLLGQQRVNELYGKLENKVFEKNILFFYEKKEEKNFELTGCAISTWNTNQFSLTSVCLCLGHCAIRQTKKVRCAGGQLITSPSLNIAKTPCTIRQGVGTYTMSSASHEHSASVTDDDDEEVVALKTPSKYSKSPTGSVRSYQAESKDGK